MKRNLGIVGGFIFIFMFVAAMNPVIAHHKKNVLGESTTASAVNFPPITAGPGYILPDSPLFFLDQLSQVVRIAVAQNTKDRASVYKQIAGERMAELRIMFAKNNDSGINTTLFDVGSSMKSAASMLSQAKAEGGDVKMLAADLNDTIKLQKKTLDSLVEQSSGSLQLELKATAKNLQEAKAEVEDNLPEDELAKEIDESIRINVSQNIQEAAKLAVVIQNDLDTLGQMASESAQKSLTRRNEALQIAITEKNKELVVLQQKLLEEEKTKQEKVLTLQSSSSAQAKKVLGATVKAADDLQRAQDSLIKLKNQ